MGFLLRITIINFILLISIRSIFSLLNVRLEGGVQNIKAHGRIEVFHNKTWGTVCENGLDDKVCIVVCRQLGFSGGLCVKGENDGMCVTNNKKIFTEIRDHNVPIWTGNVECTGNEDNLGQCLMINFGEANCGHHEDGGCICGDIVNEKLSKGEATCNRSRHRIRPFEGSDVESAGTVEVQNEDGQWGIVCDDGWDDSDAHVLCNCLGYNDSRFFRAMIYSPDYNSPSILPVHYNNMDCELNPLESPANLWDCNSTTSNFECDPHLEAAAVSCASDMFHYKDVRPKVETSCDGSILEGCFANSDDLLDIDQFSIKPECNGVQFVKKINKKVCFLVDMLKCLPFYSKIKKGISELCYDVQYENIRQLDKSLKHGSSWTQRICCGIKMNASILGSFATLRKSFKKVKTDNKMSNNISIDCFLGITPDDNRSLDFPVEVNQGSPVSCYVDLSTWNTNFLLTVPDCFFLPDPDDMSMSFQFLQDKCVTSKLGMEFFSPNRTRWGFRFKVPMFEDKDSLYVMCKIHLCDPLQEGKPVCDRSCRAKHHFSSMDLIQKRRKRNSYEDNQTVNGGPFIVLSKRNEPLIVRYGSEFKIVASPFEAKIVSSSIRIYLNALFVVVEVAIIAVLHEYFEQIY